MITLQGRIFGKVMRLVLTDYIHPMVQCLFSNNDAVFQEDRFPVLTACYPGQVL